jgi:transmembrane sensor
MEILELLKRYRAGQCTPDEIVRVEAWFNSFPELQDDPAYTVAANEAAAATLKQLFPEKKKNLYIPLLRVAAILIIAVAGLLFFFRKPEKVPVTYATIKIGKGERKKLTLPDGSTVVMNASSELRLPSDFGAETREVYITGEGMLDVTKSEKPFIVHTGKLKTTVLGTSFDVRAYPEEKNIRIAVLTGKVKVEDDHQVIAAGITPDQVLTYTEQHHQLDSANVKEISGWEKNQFYFHEASLEEIAEVLERQYNIKITLTGNHKKSCRYTLQLKNESVENAIYLLSQLSGITYQLNHNEIKINTTSCE